MEPIVDPTAGEDLTERTSSFTAAIGGLASQPLANRDERTEVCVYKYKNVAVSCWCSTVSVLCTPVPWRPH